MNLGAMLHLVGKLREAESHYLTAWKLNPGDPSTKTNLERLHNIMRAKRIPFQPLNWLWCSQTSAVHSEIVQRWLLKKGQIPREKCKVVTDDKHIASFNLCATLIWLASCGKPRVTTQQTYSRKANLERLKQHFKAKWIPFKPLNWLWYSQTNA